MSGLCKYKNHRFERSEVVWFLEEIGLDSKFMGVH